MKRFFDIFISLLILIFFSPLLILITLLNIIFQGFPVIFLHSRLGKNGKSFELIKFRSMINGPSLSAEHDIKRITKWGRILRRTSIDELPVLLNVLKGEMSLVGPRPLPVKYLGRFNFFQKKRLHVLPGITGLAQVKGRNHLSWEERFNYDVDYVKNQSFILDIKILLFTIIIVFRGIGVTSKEQEIMPEFLGEKSSNNTDK